MNKVKKVIEKVVLVSQNAFLEVRQILDVMFTVNDAINS